MNITRRRHHLTKWALYPGYVCNVLSNVASTVVLPLCFSASCGKSFSMILRLDAFSGKDSFVGKTIGPCQVPRGSVCRLLFHPRMVQNYVDLRFFLLPKTLTRYFLCSKNSVNNKSYVNFEILRQFEIRLSLASLHCTEPSIQHLFITIPRTHPTNLSLAIHRGGNTFNCKETDICYQGLTS